MLKAHTTLSSCGQLSQYKSFAKTLLEPFPLGGAVNFELLQILVN
jgi:hypothetical protein